MLTFALSYSDILKRNNEQTRLAQNDFHEKLKLFTGVDLIEAFVEQKRTGSERPGMTFLFFYSPFHSLSLSLQLLFNSKKLII